MMGLEFVKEWGPWFAITYLVIRDGMSQNRNNSLTQKQYFDAMLATQSENMKQVVEKMGGCLDRLSDKIDSLNNNIRENVSGPLVTLVGMKRQQLRTAKECSQEKEVKTT